MGSASVTLMLVSTARGAFYSVFYSTAQRLRLAIGIYTPARPFFEVLAQIVYTQQVFSGCIAFLMYVWGMNGRDTGWRKGRLRDLEFGISWISNWVIYTVPFEN